MSDKQVCERDGCENEGRYICGKWICSDCVPLSFYEAWDDFADVTYRPAGKWIAKQITDDITDILRRCTAIVKRAKGWF